MLHFSRILCFFVILSSFFSCARREQALYQRSTRDNFAQSTTQQALTNNQLLSDTSQAVVIPAPETIEASVQTNSIATFASPEWRRTSKINSPREKTTTLPSIARQQKARVYKSFLRKSFADAPVQTSGLAIASLVCGILSFFVLGIVLGPLAVIFGGIALSKIRQNPEIKGRGMAVAGLVLGIVATVILIVVLASR